MGSQSIDSGVSHSEELDEETEPAVDLGESNEYLLDYKS